MSEENKNESVPLVQGDTRPKDAQGNPIRRQAKASDIRIEIEEPQFPINYQTRANMRIVDYLITLPDADRLIWLKRCAFKPDTIQRFVDAVAAEIKWRKKKENEGLSEPPPYNGHDIK